MSCPQNTPCNPCLDCPPAPALNLPPCPGGEPCEEVAQVDCVGYTGPNLPALGILSGNRMLTVLTKLHKIINSMSNAPVALINYTATNTATVAPVAPLVVTYLGLGPVYTSTSTGVGSGTTITVGSTTGLVAGMAVEVISGTGAFAPGTTVLSITSSTTFTVTVPPVTPLSGAVVEGRGTDHQIFTLQVAAGTPRTFKAFAGSPVKVSGTGTII